MQRAILWALALMSLLLGSCLEDDIGPQNPDEPLDAYPELRAPVEIRIDDLGIPHIDAENDLDLFFAAGYLQAKDRLFAVEIARRKAAGTLAEALGEDALSSDIQARTLGFARWGSLSLQKLREDYPQNYNLIVAFAGGLNRRVREIQAGQEARPEAFAALDLPVATFSPEDTLAIGTRIQFGFSSTLDFDLLNSVLERIAPGASELPLFAPAAPVAIMNPDAPAAPLGPMSLREGTATPGSATLSTSEAAALLDALARFRDDLDVGEGSNAWAVHGDHTASGRPMLANDSHAAYADPNHLFLAHYRSTRGRGTWDAIGFGFTGVPGVQLGHNRRLAWAATTNFADQTDLWDVSVVDDQARFGDDDIALLTRDELIRIKQADGSYDERSLTVREVPGVGVLIPEEMLPVPASVLSQGSLLLGWPGFGPVDDFNFFVALQRAQSLDDLREALPLQQTGMQNWTAITADGMTYATHGLVPDRTRGAAASPQAHKIMDGSDPANTWTGAFLPPERLPSLDGAQPFIATANNDPWGHTFDDDPLNDSFYYGSFFAPGFRAERLHAELTRLTDDGDVGREQLQALQLDLHSGSAARLVPLLADAIAAVDDDDALAAYSGRDDLQAAVDELTAWDLQMRADSPTPTLFRLWLAILSRDTLEDDLGLLFDAIDDAQPVTMVKLTVAAHTQPIPSALDGSSRALMLAALDRALPLRDALDDPLWGAFHAAEFETPDARIERAQRGGGDTSVNVAQVRCWTDAAAIADACRSEAGAVFRTVTSIDADGTPVTWFNWPRGNAGDTQDWLDGVYARWPFRPDEVRAATDRVIELN